jgi:hypothetical protein
MGWSTGSSVLSEIAQTILNYVGNEDDRKMIYEDLVEIFQEYDCDTLDECAGIDFILDEVLVEQGFIEKEQDN